MRLPKTLRLAFLIFIVGAGYSEALTCYVCSSDKLASCATLQTQTLPVVLCPPKTDSCFTRIENGVTIRGCSPVPIVVSGNKDNYETCNYNKCNDNIFPEDRIHCLHCAGSSCVNQTDTINVRHPCVNYDVNDKCYSIFSPDGKFAYRGCTSEPELSFGNAYCKEHVQQCAECSESGCNNKRLEWSKEKLSCIKCKSVDGMKCDKIDSNLPAEECAPVVDGYENECYTYASKDVFERGCLYEASFNVQKKCLDEDECTLCKNSGCNNVNVPVEWSNKDFEVKGPSNQTDEVQSNICYAGELEPGKSFDKKTCNNSRDSCFTYIDEDKVVKGCKLEYLSEKNLGETFFESVPRTIYDICEQSLCNSQDINQLECFECKSKSGSDPKCVSGANLLSKNCSLKMIPTKCYHYIDDVLKITQRGCMSDLKNDDVLNECKKNGEKCKQCDDSRCNVKPEFEKCLTCDAGSTACNSVQCQDYYDQCYSHLNELGVRKGCLSAAKIDHPAIEIVEDCKKDKSDCKLCSGKVNCNSETVLEEHCIVCDSEKQPQCIANPIEDLMKGKCPPTLEAMGCFTSLKDQTGVIRGCMKSLSTAEQKNCQGHSNTCKSCFGDSCNDKVNVYTCHSCVSAKDPKCLINPDSGHSVTCVNSKRCYTKNENGQVKRGCVGDTIVPQAEKCTEPLCVTCNDKMNCNSKPVEKCIKCNTKKNGVECQKHPEKFAEHICGLELSKTEGCYVSIVGDQYERGYISQLSQIEKEKCLSQSSTCKSFFGSNSNHVTAFQECYKCNSRDDSTCSNKLTVYTTTEICENPSATCTTGVDKNGVTHRRCSKDKSVEEKNFKHYETCEGAKCNGGIFPKNRLQCYQCSGNSDCDFPEGSDRIENIQCNVYSEHDQCYTYKDDGGKMHRGCVSESTPGRILCDLEPSKCVKCKQSGCNNRPKLKKPSLSCIHCGDDKACAYGQDKSKSKACTEMIPYTLKEACYTRTTIPEKKSFERGCAVDFAIKNPNVPEHTLGAVCFESGCNTQNIIINQCQKCSSKLGGDCSIIKGKNLSVKCDKSPYPYDKRGCFTYVNDDQVERGCVMDLKIGREKCLKDPNTCVICKTNDCNNENRNKVERSFGHRMTSTILLNVFAAFLLFLYY